MALHRLQTSARASLILLLCSLFIRTVAPATCSAFTLNSNTYQVSPTPAATYSNGVTVTLACSAGYVQDAATDTTGTCSASGNSYSWTWNTGTTQLSCHGCAALTLNNNTYQVSPTTAASYANGTTVTLACATGYVQDAATDTTGVCTVTATGYIWSWNAGTTQLSCLGCTAPVLTSPGLVQSSAASTTYAIGSTVNLACSAGYTSIGGASTLSCASNLTWLWPTNAIDCLPNCGAITLNPNSTQISPTVATAYASGTTATLNCFNGTIAISGTSGSGLCTSTGLWSWGSAGEQQLQCFKGCNSPSSTGMSIVPSQSTFVIGDQITVSCSSGYVNVSGSGRATCNATGLWLWQGSGLALTCVQTCAFPVTVTGLSYVSSPSVTYKLNDTITARCATGYSNSSGSNTATCTTGGTWTWRDPGPLTCRQTCTVPTLTAGLTFLSSQTATYMVDDTLVIGCQTNYVYLTGNETAICRANNTWSWSGGVQLQCTPTCQPPTLGAFASITAATNKTLYVGSNTIILQCPDGYMYDSGATTGACTNLNTWTWSGATTPLSCIVIPIFMASTVSFFAPGTCQNTVLRPATTDGTCMMSCTYDGYCTGYALTSNGCYHNRPQLSSNTTTMACQVRHL